MEIRVYTCEKKGSIQVLKELIKAEYFNTYITTDIFKILH